MQPSETSQDVRHLKVTVSVSVSVFYLIVYTITLVYAGFHATGVLRGAEL